MAGEFTLRKLARTTNQRPYRSREEGFPTFPSTPRGRTEVIEVSLTEVPQRVRNQSSVGDGLRSVTVVSGGGWGSGEWDWGTGCWEERMSEEIFKN